VLYNKNLREGFIMTGINSFVRESYIKMLTILGTAATFFALISTSTASPLGWIYEPEMPKALIRK